MLPNYEDNEYFAHIIYVNRREFLVNLLKKSIDEQLIRLKKSYQQIALKRETTKNHTPMCHRRLPMNYIINSSRWRERKMFQFHFESGRVTGHAFLHRSHLRNFKRVDFQAAVVFSFEFVFVRTSWPNFILWMGRRKIKPLFNRLTDAVFSVSYRPNMRKWLANQMRDNFQIFYYNFFSTSPPNIRCELRKCSTK